MIWQDAVISGANLLFAYSTFYQALHGFREKKATVTLTTSGLTFAGLFAMAVSFFTLGLYLSTLFASVNGAFWLILFIQGMVYGKAQSKVAEDTNVKK